MTSYAQTFVNEVTQSRYIIGNNSVLNVRKCVLNVKKFAGKFAF